MTTSFIATFSVTAGWETVHPINWRKKYAGLMPSEMKRLRQLEEENAKLKRIVADLSLDKAMLQEVLAKNVWSASSVQGVVTS
jgi:putative transposase